MSSLADFDPNVAGNPHQNIYGFPTTEDNAGLIILPVPWEVTVSYGAGTARAADSIFNASLQVDLFDFNYPDAWKKGFYMRQADKKILAKSDYLRKQAELYIAYISKGEDVEDNSFMTKAMRDINEGSAFLNNWVYEQTGALLNRGKLVALLGGDHSTSLGYLRAIADKYPEFGVLQIDAHCDLRAGYEGFTYSHASIMYNALEEIPQIQRLVQVGTRDCCQEEWDYVCNSNRRVVTFFDQHFREKQFEGQTWQHIVDDIVNQLPQQVYLSFDIDGLDPKLCPRTGTPVQGGLEAEQVFYLLRRMTESGRQLIGFDLVEVGTGDDDWDANVGARVLLKLCNIFAAGNP